MDYIYHVIREKDELGMDPRNSEEVKQYARISRQRLALHLPLNEGEGEAAGDTSRRGSPCKNRCASSDRGGTADPRTMLCAPYENGFFAEISRDRP